MSQSIFVRGLWGGIEAGVGYTVNMFRTLHAITTESYTHRKRSKIEPLRIYVWGEWNYELLQRLDRSPFRVSSQPLAQFERHDMTPWRHKFECMRLAFAEGAEEVVWLDWDVAMAARGIPDNFWGVLRDGQPLQGVLRHFHNPQCHWREKKDDQRICVHGACLYCRESRIIDELIDIMVKEHPHEFDEPTVSHWIDRDMGGWQGPEAFRDEGYQMPFYDQEKKYVFPMEPPVVFRNIGTI